MTQIMKTMSEHHIHDIESTPKSHNQTEAYNAVQTNNTVTALGFIGNGISPTSIINNITEMNGMGWTMLHWATFHGNEELVQALLATNKLLVNEKECTQIPQVKSPLHIASQRGHLRVCWILLLESFSLQDTDQYGNTPLHTAAANGFDALVQCFIDFGAEVSYKKNIFHLTPIQVASNEACRMILRNAIELEKSIGSSSSTMVVADDIAKVKRGQMIDKYRVIESNLVAKLMSMNMSMDTKMNDIDSHDNIVQLKQSIDRASTFGIRTEILNIARNHVTLLEMREEVSSNIEAITLNAPIVTPTEYASVNNLRRVVKKAEEELMRRQDVYNVNVSAFTNIPQLPRPDLLYQLVNDAKDVCKVSQSEFNLKATCRQLEKIRCACKSDMKYISILQGATSAAEDINSDATLVREAKALQARLTVELELKDAVDKVPSVRLPVTDMSTKRAREYWCPEDMGHIEETEEYPLPPPSDGSEYIWIKSEALQSVEEAIQVLRKVIHRAIKDGGNGELISSCKNVLNNKCKDIRALNIKDEEDRLACISVAEKAAKKVMKRKKAKSKAKV